MPLNTADNNNFGSSTSRDVEFWKTRLAISYNTLQLLDDRLRELSQDRGSALEGPLPETFILGTPEPDSSRDRAPQTTEGVVPIGN